MTNNTAATLMATISALKPALSLIPLTKITVTIKVTKLPGKFNSARWMSVILDSTAESPTFPTFVPGASWSS